MENVELNRMDKKVVNECMEILSNSIKMMDRKTEALLYFQFEDLLNKSLGTSINNSDRGKVYEDGEQLISRYEIAREDYLETLKIVNNGTPK